MAIGDIVTASKYNEIQSRVVQIFGTGSGQFGYGQPIQSSQLASSIIVDDIHMSRLKTDLSKLYAHQTGTNPTLTDVTELAMITNAVYAQYENISTTSFTNKFNIYELTQADIETKLTSVRNSTWGVNDGAPIITHNFKVVFDNANHRRHFFNSGGQIIFNATLISGTGAKFDEWVGMLNTTIVKFEHNSTLDQSNSVLTNIGNYDLTSQYQTIGQRQGTGSYSENLYKIYARQTSTSVLQFKVEFNDADTGGSAGSFVGDEPVSGTLTNSISQRRATGSNVSITTPAYNTVTKLE
tara:strand:+ start:195 stop:1082 length:888 start_codon:yes stop_codon:yes gene_type:complete